MSVTWKVPTGPNTDMSIRAMLYNPESYLGKYLSARLETNNLQVFYSNSHGHPQNNLFTKYPSGHFIPVEKYQASSSTTQFKYAIYLLKDLEDIKKFASPITHHSGETKNIFVVPFELGTDPIHQLSQKTNEKIAVVPPGFTSPPGAIDRFVYFKLLTGLSKHQNLQLNPYDNSQLSFASFDDLATAILETLFIYPKKTIRWLIPQPLNLATTVAYLQNNIDSADRSFVSFHQDAPPYSQSIILPSEISYWPSPTSPQEIIKSAVEELKGEEDDFALPYLSPITSSDPLPLSNSRGSTPELEQTPLSPPPQTLLPEEPPPGRGAFNLSNVLGRGLKSLIILAFLAFLIFIIFLSTAAWDLYRSYQLVSTSPAQIPVALNKAIGGYQKILWLDQGLSLLKAPLNKMGLGDLHLNFLAKISSVETLVYTQITMLRLYRDLKSVYGADISEPELPLISQAISDTFTQLTLSKAVLAKEGSWLKKIPFVSSKTNQLESLLPSISYSLVDMQKLLPVFPLLGGYDRPKTYLLLFQNNMELRPTGGFIGSYGLLSVSKGKITKLEVKDIYDADGQLQGHVEPPLPIKTVLGEAGWKMRDSNWDPDFPTSALRAQWFLEKETNTTVDGTIAITLKSAQVLLAAIGPIELADYQETITSDNLFSKAQYYSEANFFPGSSQKKDFLGALAVEMFNKLKDPTPAKSVKLLSVAIEATRSRDIQAYFSDPRLQKAISQVGWDGSIANPKRCTSPNCIDDYLSIIDANLGVNKDNFALDKKYLSRINIEKNGNIKHHLTLIFTNKAQSESWPLGLYRSYLRFYLPLKTKVNTIEILNPLTGQKEGITQYDLTEEHNLQIVGFSFDIPIMESREIEIVYTLSAKLSPAPKGSYILTLRKQAGTNYDPYDLVINLPSTFNPTLGPSSIEGKLQTFDFSNSIHYNLNLSSDNTLQVLFNKNNQ